MLAWRPIAARQLRDISIRQCAPLERPVIEDKRQAEKCSNSMPKRFLKGTWTNGLGFFNANKSGVA
jgi:hypothetical protein